MKIIAILVIVAAFWLVIANGNCTAAVILLAILGPEIFERKKKNVKER